MTRQFSSKRRNAKNRKEKPVMLLIAEGKNETEKRYFEMYRKPETPFAVHIAKAGYDTHPKGLAKKLNEEWTRLELDHERGDMTVAVFDLDCDERKAENIISLAKEYPLIHYAISNPCFEVWYLLHYRYSSKAYASSEAVIRDLRRYLPSYQKSSSVYQKINSMTDNAIHNAEALSKHFEELGRKWPSNSCNPRTDVVEIVKKLIISGTPAK